MAEERKVGYLLWLWDEPAEGWRRFHALGLFPSYGWCSVYVTVDYGR